MAFGQWACLELGHLQVAWIIIVISLELLLGMERSTIFIHFS